MAAKRKEGTRSAGRAGATGAGRDGPGSVDAEALVNEGTTGQGDGGATKPKRSFGGLTPQEAGRKSAEARKRRDLAQAESLRASSDGRIVFVRVPVHLGDIVAALANGATKGDAGQARELRSWMAEFPVDDDTDVSALDRRTRTALKARLLADLAELTH